MQRRQDHFQCRFVLELGVRVDGDAAAVVGDGDGLVLGQMDMDAAGMSGDRFVHGVVHDFRRQVVQGALIDAADVHAGPAADRFQPLQDLDVHGRIVFAPGRPYSCLYRRLPGRLGGGLVAGL